MITLLFKRLASLCFFLPVLALAQIPTTPNIGLQVPPYGTANWNAPVNYNSTQLDLYLSGSLPLPALSVTGNFTAPGLTSWNTLTTYGLGSVVFYQGSLYQSLIASNTGNVPSSSPSDWSATFSGMVYPPTTGIACSTGTAWCASYPLSTFLQAANNLSDLGSASTARTNLGLGTAATQPSSAFDAAGAAAAAQAAAEAFASNASNLSSGTVPAAVLPADVAKTDAANSFSQPQTFTDGLTTNALNVGAYSVTNNGSWTNIYYASGAWMAQYGQYYNLPYNAVRSWTTGQDNGPDTGLSRAAANIVAVGNGNSTDASGAIEAAFHTTGVGAQITAAATIAPTNQIQHITGATTVETITVPSLVTAGWKLTLIADAAGVNFGTTGNVAVATTMAQNQVLDFVWDGTKFYPASGGSSPIFIHTLSGATPTVAVNSASVPAVDQNYLQLTANVTSFPLPTAVANGEIVRVTIQQGATTAYTLTTGAANSPFTAGSGTTLVNSVPGGCPTIGTTTGTTAPSELFVSLAYNSALTQWSILGCQGTSPTPAAGDAPLSATGIFGSYPVGTPIAIGSPRNSGHFASLQVTTTLVGSCGTAPSFSVFDGTSHTGTALTASATTQTFGNANNVAQTQTFVAGDNIGIYISSAGVSCPSAIFSVSATLSEP